MKKIKTIILIIGIFTIFEIRAVAGYIEKINLKVIAQIAMPILEVTSSEKISGNYYKISEVPEYYFEIKNYNELITSEIDLSTKLEAVSNDKFEFEIIDCDTNEVILNNSTKSNEINFEKNNQLSKKYKLVLEDNISFAKDSLKLIISAKYCTPKEIEIFDINFDKRALTLEVLISEQDKKYTNNDVIVQIKCNKEIKPISGFELSEDKTCLTKTYQNNTVESIIIEDYFENKKTIEIAINNIDKTFPEISGIEEGGSYVGAVNLVYKDNIGIKSITVENTSKKQKYSTSFTTENTIIDNQFLVANNTTINPYYLNQSGNYIITVEDFAGNKTVKYICVI